jgi:hypothetical protein
VAGGHQQDGGEFDVSLEPFSCENLKYLRQGAIRVSRTRADISAGLPTGRQVLRKLGHWSCGFPRYASSSVS